MLGHRRARVQTNRILQLIHVHLLFGAGGLSGAEFGGAGLEGAADFPLLTGWRDVSFVGGGFSFV